MDKIGNDLSDTVRKTVAKIHQSANNSLSFEQFIKKVVLIIHNHFNLYSTNLFFLEDSGKWAVLYAGTGGTCQIALERGHKLAVDGQSMVGKVIRTGTIMVSLDVEEERDKRFWSAVPPPVHSELVVPLKTMTPSIIGVLDVQSSEYNAFGDAEISNFQSIADEITNTIDRRWSKDLAE